MCIASNTSSAQSWVLGPNWLVLNFAQIRAMRRSRVLVNQVFLAKDVGTVWIVVGQYQKYFTKIVIQSDGSEIGTNLIQHAPTCWARMYGTNVSWACFTNTRFTQTYELFQLHNPPPTLLCVNVSLWCSHLEAVKAGDIFTLPITGTCIYSMFMREPSICQA